MDQIFDILTKTISSSKFPTLRYKLRVDNLTTLSLSRPVNTSS